MAALRLLDQLLPGEEPRFPLNERLQDDHALHLQPRLDAEEEF